MRTKQEIQNDIDNLDVELRSIMEEVKDDTKAFDKDAVAKRRAEIAEKRAALCKEMASLQAPPTPSEVQERAGTIYDPEVWKRAAADRRSITLGTTPAPGIGSINQLTTLFKDISDSDDILKRATYFYGPNATTSIPVLAPMDDIGDYAEGTRPVENATSGVTTGGIAEDTSAAITTTEIQPKAYARVLPITYEMQTMGSVNFEAQINDVFTKAFNRTMHKGMLTGDGADKRMKGILTSAKATDATKIEIGASTIKINDLAGLALSVLGKSESFTLLMNPSVYQTLLSDSSTSEDIKIYKEGLIRDKSIEGVPILLDSLLTVGTAAGSPLVIAVPFSRYAIGIAQQIVIKAIEDKDSTYTYFKAVMFFSGKQISDKDLHSLVVKA